jgi:hypothetical protein
MTATTAARERLEMGIASPINVADLKQRAT